MANKSLYDMPYSYCSCSPRMFAHEIKINIATPCQGRYRDKTSHSGCTFLSRIYIQHMQYIYIQPG